MAGKNDNSQGPISVAGFGLRFLAALILVILTYNPTGASAYDWISTAIGESSFGPLHLLLIGVLLAGWAVFWISTWRSLGTLGVVLASIVLGAIVWLFVDLGWLNTASVSAMTWVFLVVLAALLTIGVSWSHVWRQITGQINVEDVDD